MSDKTFTAGSEEDFIRMLQEQMANGGISDDLDLSSLTLPDDDGQGASVADATEKTKEKNKFQRPQTLADRIIKITSDGKVAIAVYNERYCVTKGFEKNVSRVP